MLDGASPGFVRVVPVVLFFVRFVIPPIVDFVVFYTGRNLFTTLSATFRG